MEERLLLKITVTEENEEGCHVHSECPINTADDGLILVEIFQRLMKRNPYFAAALETAYMVLRGTPTTHLKDLQKDLQALKALMGNPSKTQS